MGSVAQEIESKIQDLFNGINDVLSWVPSFLSDLIKPIQGSVDALNQAAQDWSTKVEKVVSGVAGTLQPDQLQASNDWTVVSVGGGDVVVAAEAEQHMPVLADPGGRRGRIGGLGAGAGNEVDHLDGLVRCRGDGAP